MHLGRLIGPELLTLVRESPGEVAELVDDIHPEDIVEIIDGLEDDEAKALMMSLPTDFAAQVFGRLGEDRQGRLTELLGTGSVARIATEMDADDRVDFFSMLPPSVGEPLLEELEKVDPKAAEDVEALAKWPEKCAGGLMTTDYIAVRPGVQLSEAIDQVRSMARDAETLDTIYVVGEANRLLGYLTLRQLLLSRPTDRVRDVMFENVISVPPELDQEEVAKILAKYDLHTLPVANQERKLLGVITSDDILDVIVEEQGEDVHKMGAIAPIGEGYFDATIGTYILKRAPWLLVLFVGGFFTTSALKAYDEVLATFAQLAFYVPLLISAGGNSGSQSSTLVIRGLSVGEISTRDWWRVLLRELVQGLALGVMLSALGVIRVLLAGDGWSIALVVALTLLGIVLMGCVVGGMLPILLHRVGLDPATSSNPFIATLVDVFGILIYLTLAKVVLGAAFAAAGISG